MATALEHEPQVKVDSIPKIIRNRAWWALPLVSWAMILGFSLRSHLNDLERHGLDVATEGARNMFRMVVLARAWNAEHGGVYVPVTPTLQPNPYLEHPRRDLVTRDGQALTMVNPAYMTRLIAELANNAGGSVFHITSLNPIRPKNQPDAWERAALERFERGTQEVLELVATDGSDQTLRYMAPLQVTKPCMACHEKQGYKIGDIRGGISVTQSYGPVRSTLEPSRRQAYLNYIVVFLLVTAGAWWLLEQLRRRWLMLVSHTQALDATRSRLESANRDLGRARDQAEAANRAKSVFLANMSHELKTPLNGIMGLAHLLTRSAEDPMERQFLTQISESGAQLDRLIRDLLDMAKLETDGLSLQVSTFELGPMLQRIMASLTAEAERKEISVMLDIDGELPRFIRGDSERIGQILDHFTMNAVKFTDRGSITLRVRTVALEAGHPGIRFEVQDTGPGISEKDIPRLFRPFEQVDGSLTRRHGGTGLGLALCLHLATLMRGSVGVESVPAVGSLFWLQLPIDPVPKLEDTPQATTPCSDGPLPPELPAASRATALLETAEQVLALLDTDDYQAVVLWREVEQRLEPLLGTSLSSIGQAIAACRFQEARDELAAALKAAAPKASRRDH